MAGVITIGQVVTIGGSALTWTVLRLNAVSGRAYLKSGQTGRARWEPVANLKPYTRMVERA